jgi:hypothetical protein
LGRPPLAETFSAGSGLASAPWALLSPRSICSAMNLSCRCVIRATRAAPAGFSMRRAIIRSLHAVECGIVPACDPYSWMEEHLRQVAVYPNCRRSSCLTYTPRTLGVGSAGICCSTIAFLSKTADSSRLSCTDHGVAETAAIFSTSIFCGSGMEMSVLA